jgi:hypothetical protein
MSHRHPAARAAARWGPAGCPPAASPGTAGLAGVALEHRQHRQHRPQPPGMQHIPYHSDVVERQQHTADEQSRSGRPFPSCPAVLPVQKRMGFPLLFTLHGRSTAAGHPLGWRPDSACVWCPSARTSTAAASATSKEQLHCSTGRIHLTAVQALETMSDGELRQARDRRRAVRADGCD